VLSVVGYIPVDSEADFVNVGCVGTVFKDGPRGRVCVRVFIGMSMCALCNTLLTKAAPSNPSVGVSTRTHSTLLTLSSSLRVKGLTQRCYGSWTKAYKLAPPLLN
jgi:hypothetical protein